MPVRVVIAEDEAIIRLDLKEILEEEGYEVVGESGRGDEAVELVRKHHPDLAILDIKMPGMDGLTAAKEITGERLAAVLILTAFSQRDLIDQAREAGGQGQGHPDGRARTAGARVLHLDSAHRHARTRPHEGDRPADHQRRPQARRRGPVLTGRAVPRLG